MKIIKALLLLIFIFLVGVIGCSVYQIVQLNKTEVKIVEKVENIEDNKKDVILPIEEEKEEINEDLVKDDEIFKEVPIKEEVINIVLVGMDARSYEEKSRSDTIILLSYNRIDHSVKMFSFLRDTWVHLPERGWGRINSATAYGGVGLLINTLNSNFELDVQNYVQVKFEDFKKIIDILGGVDVELTKAEIRYINNKLHTDDNDWKNDIEAEPGIVHLNGVQTLWHCRNRSIGAGDFSRTDRQREVLSLLIEKGRKMTVPQMIELAMSASKYVNTNVPIETLISLAKDALISKDLTIETYHIPFDNMYNFVNRNGASVIDINYVKTITKLYEILGLDIPEDLEKNHPQPPMPKPKPKPKPEIVKPEVIEPEITEPEVTEPEIIEPEITESEITEPEVTEPEVTEPEITEPEAVEPNGTEPEVVEPESIEENKEIVEP